MPLCLKFPTILKLFLKYNTALPSSDPVERLFTLGGQTLVPRRNTLTNAHLEWPLLLTANRLYFSYISALCWNIHAKIISGAGYLNCSGNQYISECWSNLPELSGLTLSGWQLKVQAQALITETLLYNICNSIVFEINCADEFKVINGFEVLLSSSALGRFLSWLVFERIFSSAIATSNGRQPSAPVSAVLISGWEDSPTVQLHMLEGITQILKHRKCYCLLEAR